MYDKTYGIFCWVDNLKVFPFYIVGVSIEDSHLSNIKYIISTINNNTINTKAYKVLNKLNRYKKEYLEENIFKVHLYKLGRYELEKDDLTYAFLKGIRQLSLPYKNRIVLSGSNYLKLSSNKLSINIDNYLEVPELTIGLLYSKLLRSFCLNTYSKNINKLTYLPPKVLINETVHSILQDKSTKIYPLWLNNYIHTNYERFIK